MGLDFFRAVFRALVSLPGGRHNTERTGKKMKQLVTISAVFGFLLAPQAGAQNCSAWDNWSVRGTYTAQGAGSIDLAKEVNSTLPKGYSPQAFVQGLSSTGKAAAPAGSSRTWAASISRPR